MKTILIITFLLSLTPPLEAFTAAMTFEQKCRQAEAILHIVVEKIEAAGIEKEFSFLERQSGMSSFLSLSVAQVRRLREEYSIYTVNSARVNIASFNNGNIDYFVNALKAVL